MIEISAISKYLGHFAPDVLQDLRARHPEASAYFDPSGVPLGPEMATDPAIEAAIAMLGTVDGVASDAMVKTLARLKSTRRLALIGSLLSLVASGGVIGAVLWSEKVAAAVLALVSFLASAVPLVTAWLRGAAVGDGTIDQHFVKLRELTWDARTLHAQINRDNNGQLAPDLISRANELARSIYFTLNDLGYQTSVRPI